MNKEEIQQLFRRNSDCYADTWKHEDEKLVEGEVVMAMTEDRFMEVVYPLLSKMADQVRFTKIQRNEYEKVNHQLNRVINELRSTKVFDETTKEPTL